MYVGTSSNHNTKYQQAIVKQLVTIHRKVAILITGSLSTTATDAVLTLANLPPFHILVNRICHGAALCLATLPPFHPLHKPVTNAAFRLVKQHPTPLHNLMHRFDLKPITMEKIQAIRHHTHWKPSFKMSMIPDKEEAIADIARDNFDLKIFTDGSSMNNKIGASAVLYRDNRCKTSLQYQLGSISHHTIYEGEATGILLATNLILKETHA